MALLPNRGCARPKLEVSTVMRASRREHVAVLPYLRHGDDGALGQAHHALGHAAQDQARQAAAAVRAHHDHVGVRGELDDLVRAARRRAGRCSRARPRRDRLRPALSDPAPCARAAARTAAPSRRPCPARPRAQRDGNWNTWISRICAFSRCARSIAKRSAAAEHSEKSVGHRIVLIASITRTSLV